jgi:hypothetical protein
LPPAKEQPFHSTKEANPLVLVEPVDRTGQAAVRKRPDKVAPVPDIELHFEHDDDTEQPLENETSVSRTTAWRKRKAATEAATRNEQGKLNCCLTL